MAHKVMHNLVLPFPSASFHFTLLLSLLQALWTFFWSPDVPNSFLPGAFAHLSPSACNGHTGIAAHYPSHQACHVLKDPCLLSVPAVHEAPVTSPVPPLNHLSAWGQLLFPWSFMFVSLARLLSSAEMVSLYSPVLPWHAAHAWHTAGPRKVFPLFLLS